MGRAKQELQQALDLADSATFVLEQVGVAKRCEIHDEIYTDEFGLDLEDEDLLDLAKSALGSELDDMSEIKEQLQSAFDQLGEECGYCAKNRDS